MKLTILTMISFIILELIIQTKNWKRISKLKIKIDRMQKLKSKPIFKYDLTNEKFALDFLENRAECLEFCCQCPLYQEKVQEDKSQKLETKQ